jgi:hypothetical protein
MQDVLPEGGVIRKLWVGEAAKYRAVTAGSAAAYPTTSSATMPICRSRWTP